jgi:ATP-dependent DNA ligase
MLAQLEPRLPRGERWLYEPKLDGFRGQLVRPGRGAPHLLSRNGRDLGPWFPELIGAAATLPPGTCLDGEIVIADEVGRADFGALQERLGTARRAIAEAVRCRPAILVVFDVLRLAGADLCSVALRERRAALERVLDRAHPCLQLVAQTSDFHMAQQWLELASVEGVVAKRRDRPYVAGRARDWVKVKRHHTIDCAVIGVAGDAAAPKLVLGLRHADGQLHHFGVTRPLASDALGPLAAIIAAAGPELPAIRSRWQHDAVPPWRRVEPSLVCEVRVTNLDAARWSRFPVVFLRWRSDRSPRDCALDQFD